MEHVLWFLPKAYTIELVHFVVAHVGLIFNAITIFYALGDIKWVEENKDKWTHDECEYRSFASRRNIREELARIGLNILFTSIGWVSILNPPPNTIYDIGTDIVFQLEYTRVALTVASLILTFKSVKDLTDRYALQEMMSRGRHHGRGRDCNDE